jgi:hypothetical protein
MNIKITDGDRASGLDHHLHGLGLGLRAEPPALPGHEQITTSVHAAPKRCPLSRRRDSPACVHHGELFAVAAFGDRSR